ncbi:MAG: hypothetical protein IJT34_09275, partial [Butyrivibrio sp.]|nr:hypothetical protein [Butyrivibrio sp.]
VVKGVAQEKAGTGSLSELGRIPSKTLMEAIVRHETDDLPEVLAQSVEEAEEKLARTEVHRRPIRSWTMRISVS